MIPKKLLLSLLHRLRKPKPSREALLLRGLVSIGGALLLAFLIYFIVSAYSGVSVASLLPQGKTLLYVEKEDADFPAKLKGSPLENLVSIQPVLNLLGLDPSLIPEWARRNVGVAVIEEKPVLFFRAMGRRRALRFLRELALDKEKLENRGSRDFPIYRYPQGQNFVFAFAGPYLFIAPDITLLQGIQSVFTGASPSLEEEAEFKRALKNLPSNSWIRGYLNLERLNLAADWLNPFKEFGRHLAFAVRQKQEGFQVNSFLSFKPEFLALNPLTQPAPAHSAYELSQWIPTNGLALYLSGENLAGEWNNTLKSTEKLNPAYAVLLEGMIRAQVQKIFGNDVNLEKDLYPLLNGEYGFMIAPGDQGGAHLGLLLTHTDAEFAKTKLKKLAKGFRLLAAQFTPQVKVVPLPDGTESRELVADPESLKDIQEIDEDVELDCLEVEGSLYGFCYGVTKNLMVLANDLGLLKAILNNTREPKDTLSTHQPFRQALGNLSKVNDEMTFLSFPEVSKLLENKPWGNLLLPFLVPLDSVTWTKHVFDDGMSTEGFILIK